MRRLGPLLAIVISLGACSTDPNAARLALQTDPILVPTTRCTLGVVGQLRIARDGSNMAFIDVGTLEPQSVIWPFGFAAWLEFDTAILYASDGTVVGREGEVLANIGVAGEREGMHVCSVGARTYQ